MPDLLTTSSVIELARAIRAGETSPVTVLRAHLRRIAEVNPRINAVVQLAHQCEEQARTAADAITAGTLLGPLHGVPFTVKDNIETAGVVTAIGVASRVTTVPARDATVVKRMRSAGAILLGKTNCPPWGGGIETDNELYGRTNNPHDVTRTPGGSSGGEAAIIAAGGSPCGVGTDSGGSARLPAHFCGVAAIKPTAGLIPVTGVLDDDGPIGAISDPRTQVGLFARFVADLELILDVVCGPDRRDGGVAPVPLGDSSAIALPGLRVGVYDDNEALTPSPPTVGAVRRAADALATAGAAVRRINLPGDGHAITIEVWRSYGHSVTSRELYRLLRRWDAYRDQMLRFMAGLDVIVCPVYPTTAPLHGETNNDGTAYTTPYSLVGAPCVVLPYATSPQGLPIGIQIVANPWRDHVALAVAKYLEQMR